jgi:hypothetical protein
METSQHLMQGAYRTLTYLLAVFPAKPSLLLAKGADSWTQEALSSLKYAGLLGKNNHTFCCLRTSKDFYLTTKEEHSELSSARLMNWGTTVNGKCLTARITESPKTEKGCSLSVTEGELNDLMFFH